MAISGKIALVTGTSSGIGLSTAVQLAEHGYTVIATLRDISKADALQTQAKEAGVTLNIRQLDVQDDASITRCVQDILHAYGRIDLLVNNAGAGFLGTMEQTSMQNLQRVMDLNFFGVWRVTQAVFPSMRAAHSGRIITITSIGGLIGQPFNDAYCAAKFAVEGMMESLVSVAKQLGIDICVIEPGPVNTNFVASVVASQPDASESLQEVYGSMLTNYMGGSQERFASIGQTPAQIAQVIVQIAQEEHPHFRYTTSNIMQSFAARKFVDPSGDALAAYFEAQLKKK